MEGGPTSSGASSGRATPDPAAEPPWPLSRANAVGTVHRRSPSPATDDLEMGLVDGPGGDDGGGGAADVPLGGRFLHPPGFHPHPCMTDRETHQGTDDAGGGSRSHEMQRLSLSHHRNSLVNSLVRPPTASHTPGDADTATAEADASQPQMPLLGVRAASGTEVAAAEVTPNAAVATAAAPRSSQRSRYVNAAPDHDRVRPHTPIYYEAGPSPSASSPSAPRLTPNASRRAALFNEEQLRPVSARLDTPPPAAAARREAAATPAARAIARDALMFLSPLAREARIATIEERRVRHLYHNRPRMRLTARPRIVENIVLDRTKWEQPLCYLPLFLPCMQNAFYRVPQGAKLRTAAWEPNVSNPFSPSVIYSGTAGSAGPPEDPRQTPAVAAAAADAASTESDLSVSTAAFYHVPPTSSRLTMRREVTQATATSATPLRRPGAQLTATVAADRVLVNRHGAASPPSFSFVDNFRHLLYRCFCVRCAIAAQAESLQADMKMRSAVPHQFPCCSCLKVESRSSSELLWMVCAMDALSLGAPCGCCCYQGLGTALYGWHLRYLLRARYRIFSWTVLDLLIMCCIPGLAVDQQGAELLLNDVPETPVGLRFMH
ncbi:hypothetical protein ABB37_07986 [Leptomonas pyrrhocoris]|uniref:Uncharacterized protein n=1 Tax=Leptomonas pyrrhocoris TaxID=157538 RepID=A0A0M9FUF4_LEPPY|nr:hypothetical protein ABB37_07986 [Leptomonas pyrrhocoris]KPA76243.1 hypothetical protein ABB37_07986 [Leptomonas pyrrhocoris]|eukprot:XP_015654682.1 hypothetical protein ABB37_07986 [Leptomonas pyrrhocoris]